MKFMFSTHKNPLMPQNPGSSKNSYLLNWRESTVIQIKMTKD